MPLLAFFACPMGSASDVAPQGQAQVLLFPVDAQATNARPQTAAEQRWNGLIEAKREYTDKGQPPEKTQSSLKVDWYPRGRISLLRLQIPFPDENQEDAAVFDFFHPRLGDLKARLGFRSFPVFEHPLATFVEFTFPTANPASIGQEKYQVMAGVRLALGRITGRGLRFDLQITQTASVAGDPSAKDINKTNGELTAKKTWRDNTYVTVKLRAVTDWEKSAYTGGAVEFKGSLNINPRWSIWVQYGHGAWNQDATGMYQSKIGFGLVREIGRLVRPIAAEE